MRKLLSALAVTALVALAPAGAASATASRTCHHGASNKPCRPDPQPTHGRDCTHPSPGNPAGINQDHCLPEVTTSTTTTTAPSVTTTTLPTPVTTSTTSPASPGTTTTSTTTGSPSPSPTTSPALRPIPEHCTDAAGFSYETDPSSGCLPLGDSPAPLSAPQVSPAPSSAHELPHTGAPTDALVALGLGLVILGIAARRAARKP